MGPMPDVHARIEDGGMQAAGGVVLFERGPTRVVPTLAGELYYRECIEVLRAHRRSRDALHRLGQGLSGEVAIGLTPTLTRCVLAPVLRQFLAAHPNVRVRIVDAYGDIIVGRVRDGDLDIGIVPSFPGEPGLHSVGFARTPQFLISGRNSGLNLKHREPVELAALGPLKMVMPSGAQGRARPISAYLDSVGAQIVERLEIDSSIGVYDFVTHSDWVSIHAAIATLREFHDDSDVLVNPIVGPPLVLDLFGVERAREPASPAAQAFVDALRAYAVELEAETLGYVGVAVDH
ncbi:LysR family transcriptional regulator [Labrys sp. LIt4]|uniref:LysR family transcriptional regulator n=1 Tax=Labrys sp. LIt4 TaxID=2821355 RepID=UPI001ADF1149|nr:LysR family transcriptional regulator [Labrys sp. LIt4]MBP0582644.1 LysR family transcriptional regulator [Labrys sp. LIt4]